MAVAVLCPDRYWHPHVDKITYGSFEYTCLLYLSTHGAKEDFTGGEFVFVDTVAEAGSRGPGKAGITAGKATSSKGVQPRKGRLSCFSSGEENTHHITQCPPPTPIQIPPSAYFALPCCRLVLSLVRSILVRSFLVQVLSLSLSLSVRLSAFFSSMSFNVLLSFVIAIPACNALCHPPLP